MNLKIKNSARVDVLLGYSARQLQFAIRLGILPSPDKLSRILSRRSSPENEIKLLENVSSMKA